MFSKEQDEGKEIVNIHDSIRGACIRCYCACNFTNCLFLHTHRRLLVLSRKIFLLPALMSFSPMRHAFRVTLINAQAVVPTDQLTEMFARLFLPFARTFFAAVLALVPARPLPLAKVMLADAVRHAMRCNQWPLLPLPRLQFSLLILVMPSLKKLLFVSFKTSFPLALRAVGVY
jgi:hypothetical protein